MVKIKETQKDKELQELIDIERVARGECESRAATKETAAIMSNNLRRQRKFRAKKEAAGLQEVRHIFAKPENHRAIKCFADALEFGFIRAIKKGVKDANH